MTTRLCIAGINPEPWTSPAVDIGWRNGRPFPIVSKSPVLAAYQKAVADEIRRTRPGIEPVEDDVRLTFWLWRQLPSYVAESDRVVRKHVVDATNCQKALEDALQGILFKNDRQVRNPQTLMVEQGPEVEPFIAIEMSRWGDLDRVCATTKWAVDLGLRDRASRTDQNVRDLPEDVF